MLCEHFFTAKMAQWSVELFKATISQRPCRLCDTSANSLKSGKLVYTLTYLIFLFASHL